MRQSSSLNKVIQCVQQQQKLLPHKPPQTEDIGVIHHFTIDLLDKFTDHINRCKKYNEARIHRKFENNLSYLQEQNQSLKAKLQLQRDALPSSQKYVSDLIDKMVQIRSINEKLTKENTVLRSYPASTQRWDSGDTRNISNMLDQQKQRKLVRETVSKFMNVKKQERSIAPKQVSNFQKFLQFNQAKVSKWTLTDLFDRLEKWIVNLKDTRLLDSQRLRQKFERTYTSIEQSYPTQSIRKMALDKETIFVSRMKTEQMSNLARDQFTILQRKKKYGNALNNSELRRELTLKQQRKMVPS